MNESPKSLKEETDFLNEVGTALNSAMFIIDRLIEEIKGEQGLREDDAEVEQLFHHLADNLVKVDQQIKHRHSFLSDLLRQKIQKEQETEANIQSYL